MGFSSQSFSSGQEITTTHLNQFNENEVWLFDRFLPILNQGRVSINNLALYLVSFDDYDTGSSLIVLANNNGNGRYGATWSKLWTSGYFCAIRITIPTGIFSGKPWIVGHSVGSGAQTGMTACAHLNESATGYDVIIADVGRTPINESAGFAYTALLLGTRGGTIS